MTRAGHSQASIWFLLLLLFTRSATAASIGIDPHEIILSNGKPFTDATLFNFGKEPALLRLDLVDMAMTQDGTLAEVRRNADDERTPPGITSPFAARLLRVAPRQIEIPPGGTQKIRVMASRQSNLSEGAYHTHLFVTIIPSLQAFSNLANTADHLSSHSQQPAPGSSGTSRQASIGVVPIISIAYPVWFLKGVRHDASALISHPVLTRDKDANPSVTVRIDRSGTGRVKGDLAIFAQRAGHEQEIKIGERKNVNIYPEADHIITPVRLNPEAFVAAGLTAADLPAESVNKEGVNGRNLAERRTSLRVQFATTIPEQSANAIQSITLAAPQPKD